MSESSDSRAFIITNMTDKARFMTSVLEFALSRDGAVLSIVGHDSQIGAAFSRYKIKTPLWSTLLGEQLFGIDEELIRHCSASTIASLDWSILFDGRGFVWHRSEDSYILVQPSGPISLEDIEPFLSALRSEGVVGSFERVDFDDPD